MASMKMAVVLAATMVAVSVAAYFIKPSETATARGQGIQLDSAIPKRFGPWREDEVRLAQVVNPQTQQLLDKLYSQVLSRVYVDDRGYRVMLSLAYGDDQRGGLQAHKPEVCYPAQGFTLLSNEKAEVKTQFGSIAGRRLGTQLGSRIEPITYWFALGDRAVTSRFEYRLVEIRFGLTGQLPQGLLFRISSIDADAPRAYREHERFANDLLAAVSAGDRQRLSGLAAAN